MADAQEDAPPAPEETQPDPPTEEGQVAEEPVTATEEAPTESQEAAPEEAAAEEAAPAPEEGEATAEAPEQATEGGEEAPTEDGGEDKPAEEGTTEGQAVEGDAGEATTEGQEGEAAGEEAAAVEGAEQPEQGAEAVEPAEPAEGGEQAGEGEAATQDGESAPREGDEGQVEEQGAEAKEGEEQPAEGEEGAEKTEGEEGEKKEGEGEEGAVEGEGDGEKKEDEEGKDEGDGEGKEGEEGAVSAEGEEEAKEGEPERTESPVAVGEKLSRGGTPDDVDGAAAMDQQRLEATTPDRLDEEGHEVDRVMREQEMVEEEEEEEEEEIEEPAFKREELIERYHEALAEREQLQQQNYGLQHRLGEYFRKKKADERQDYDKNVTDQEQRYLKYMAQLEDLRRQDAMEKENFRAQIEDSKMRCQERKEKVDVERKKFMEFKKQVALNAINSRSGKPIPPKDIEQYMVNEVRKEQEVIVVRLENIKLKNKLKKKEQQLKSKEELAEGLHLIDFEQLKIENQTYNEKIEERNEELLKLRKKITGTVQVLTHLKEKLQFVQGENSEQNDQLKEVESSLAQSRDILSRTKQARDALRIDNNKLRQNCGLLGNEALLRDFEERKDEGDELRAKLDQLKMKHAELTLHCNQVRRKIDQARQTVV